MALQTRTELEDVWRVSFKNQLEEIYQVLVHVLMKHLVHEEDKKSRYCLQDSNSNALPTSLSLSTHNWEYFQPQSCSLKECLWKFFINPVTSLCYSSAHLLSLSRDFREACMQYCRYGWMSVQLIRRNVSRNWTLKLNWIPMQPFLIFHWALTVNSTQTKILIVTHHKNWNGCDVWVWLKLGWQMVMHWA